VPISFGNPFDTVVFS